ncbi:MAG: hypothetical protein KC646_12985 [Candidatus Cloacimonetes bacterium]|nr:hypothetical protein [Candidatus Cloacimonadota bacterium]
MHLQKSFLILFALLLTVVASISANNKSFVYGLTLTNAAGTPLNLTSNVHEVQVRLFPTLTGGSSAASMVLSNVAIQNGFMQMSLFPALTDGTLIASNPYLEITITKVSGSTPIVMSPRVEIPYVPAAFEAYQVGNYTSSDLATIDNRSTNNDSTIGSHTSRIATLESFNFTDRQNISKNQTDINTHSINLTSLVNTVSFLNTNQTANAASLIMTAASGSVVTSKIVVMSPAQTAAFVVESSGRVLITSGLSFDAANNLYGTQAGTHINLGKNSSTGQNGLDFSWVTISGGKNHSASANGATISGGDSNTVAGTNSNVNGGYLNNVAGHHSAVLGGSTNTIGSNGHYATILGGSKLNVNHEYSGGYNGSSQTYTISRSHVFSLLGVNVGVATTNPLAKLDVHGAIKVSATTATTNVAGMIQYKNGQFEGFNGSIWKKLDLSSTSGGGMTQETAAGFVRLSSVTDKFAVGHLAAPKTQFLVVGSMAHDPSSNLHGTTTATHINWGMASTTGKSGMNQSYITLSGGTTNKAEGDHSTISGGSNNTVWTTGTTIGGGAWNEARGYSTISGGKSNIASGWYSSISGGMSNTAAIGSWYNTISGGRYNWTSNTDTSVGGGYMNKAWTSSTISGGAMNYAKMYSAVSGGMMNMATGAYSSIGGGTSNSITTNAWYNTIAGGRYNWSEGYDNSVGGGYKNKAWTSSTISGGVMNYAKNYGSITGGGWNKSTGWYSSVLGGKNNTATANYSSVLGGSWLELKGDNSIGFSAWSTPTMVTQSNVATFLGVKMGIGTTNPMVALDVNGVIKAWAIESQGKGFVLSGSVLRSSSSTQHGIMSHTHTNWGLHSATGLNTTTISYVTIGGGLNNHAFGDSNTISGGMSNSTTGANATVGGGLSNMAMSSAAIAGGELNHAQYHSTVSGGKSNYATGWYTSIGGGWSNKITTTSMYSNISGGRSNWIDGHDSSIGGGHLNKAWTTSTISGGAMNYAKMYSAVSGGMMNMATGAYSSIGGGHSNSITTNAWYNSIAGGRHNWSEGYDNSVGGGHMNKAWTTSTISGGAMNYAKMYSAVSGGMMNMATGAYSSIGGGHSNSITTNAWYNTIAGGRYNWSEGYDNSVGGGYMNKAWTSSTISGGVMNYAKNYGVIAGGAWNKSTGWYSSVLGGKNNTATANYSSILGGNWLDLQGDRSIGFNGTSSPYTVTQSNVATFLGVKMGIGTTNPMTALDVKGTIKAWAIESQGTGFILSGSVLRSSSSTQYGIMSHTHTNWGLNSETGLTTTTIAYVTIGGGKSNNAYGNSNTISGGMSNATTGYNATIGGGLSNMAMSTGVISGGELNNAQYYSTVSGGKSNYATGWYTSIGGGWSNKITTTSMYSNISGGRSNWIDGHDSSIGGGYMNKAWTSSTISGGAMNYAKMYSAVSGGMMNMATGPHSTIGGGMSNVVTSAAWYNTIAGGRNNWSEGYDNSVGGGYMNKAWTSSTISGGAMNYAKMYSAVSGGMMNMATGAYSAIGGGMSNIVTSAAWYNTIAGGRNNWSEGYDNSVGGGYMNKAWTSSTISGGTMNEAKMYSAVSGGTMNKATGSYSYIGGGLSNIARGSASTISGGSSNITSGSGSTIGGGGNNSATGDTSTIAGGQDNSTSANHSSILGGWNNSVSGSYSSIGGGMNNNVTSDGSTIVNGYGNTISGGSSVISGGGNNSITTNHAVINGGQFNQIGLVAVGSVISGGANNDLRGPYSTIAGGRRMRVDGEGVFAFNGSDNAVTVSSLVTNAAVFMVEKFGIGHAIPQHALQVSVGSICSGSSSFCATKANSVGVIYASTTVYDGADYAEYFEAEQDLSAGTVVGLNIENGLVRQYVKGDQLLGVVSTKPGVLGNASARGGHMVAVALVGQVPITRSQIIFSNNQAYTRDGKRIGYQLKNGNFYISVGTNKSHTNEINDLKKQVDDMKQLLKTQMYLIQSMKKQLNFVIQNQ